MSRGEYYENIPISPENLEKMMKNRQDVAGLERVPIWYILMRPDIKISGVTTVSWNS